MPEVVTGVLTEEEGATFVLGADGARHFEEELIWPGFLQHWNGKRVRGRTLAQRDYARDRPIVLLWPDEPPPEPCVELYYLERLTSYWESLAGHLALSVDGAVFNFSPLLSENESTTPEEYFYRPALGEFAPHPVRGKAGHDEQGRPYHDKFGRAFMRTVHVLRVTGLDHHAVHAHLRGALDAVHGAPRNPRRPDRYAQFSMLRRSCTAFSREALRAGGLAVSGFLPRDLFVSAAWAARKLGSARFWLYKLPQLVVKEAPASAPSWLLHPVNHLRHKLLRVGRKP